jgi:LmbE family N-acetylglucosaminyl deacetylase
MLSAEFLARPGAGRTILCLGAHCDDIEIGCGGTILKFLESHPGALVHWVVFSSDEQRAAEARDSAAQFLTAAAWKRVIIKDFRNSFFPSVSGEIKEYFEELKNTVTPDLIFTHYRHDLHQDHALISQLTWNTFRDHLILEYEIPKYDGDFGAPNIFSPLEESICAKKIDLIVKSFLSQQNKPWFDPETFRAVARLRGVEANAPSRYAEAFYCRKVVLGFGGGAT